MARHVRIENRVEQRGDRARDAAGGIERAAMFQRPDELADRSLSCRTRKRLNATLFSNSQKKVLRSISASLVSRNATTS
jgi:hypothetical protein